MKSSFANYLKGKCQSELKKKLSKIIRYCQIRIVTYIATMENYRWLMDKEISQPRWGDVEFKNPHKSRRVKVGHLRKYCKYLHMDINRISGLRYSEDY